MNMNVQDILDNKIQLDIVISFQLLHILGAWSCLFQTTYM